MQVSTIVESSAPPAAGFDTVQEQAKPGEFDQFVAEIFALLNAAQGQVNSGSQAPISAPAGSNPADTAFLIEGRKTAGSGIDGAFGIHWLQPAGAVAADQAVENLEMTAEMSAETAEMISEQTANIIAGNTAGKTAEATASVAVEAPGDPAAQQRPVEVVNMQNMPIPAGNFEETDKTGERVIFRVGKQAPETSVDQNQNTLPETADFEGMFKADQVKAPVMGQGATAVVNVKQTKSAGFDETARITKFGQQGNLPPAEKAPNGDSLSNESVPAEAREYKQGAGKEVFAKAGMEAELVRPAGKTNPGERNPARNAAEPVTGKANLAPTQHPQFDLNSLSRSAGDVSRGADLNGVKEKLLQEIRHVFTAYKGDETQVRLKLDSEQLGQLTIKLFFNKGELSAHFYTESSSVKSVLESSIQQLKDSLAQQDLRLNEALVFNTDDRGGGPGQYYGERSKQGLSPYGKYNYHSDLETREEAMELPSVQAGHSRVNYLI